MPKPVETANPQQYLRLLLMRLLETQAILRPLINQPTLAPIKDQFLVNEYTLSEVKLWLEGQANSSPLGPSMLSAQSAAEAGPRSSPEIEKTDSTTESGTPSTPFAWRTWQATEPKASSQVRSSLPSSTILPPSAEIIRGRVVFRPPSLSAKPPSTSTGGADEKDD